MRWGCTSMDSNICNEIKKCPFCGGEFELAKPWYTKDESRRIIIHKVPYGKDCVVKWVEVHYEHNELIGLLNQRYTDG